MAKDCCKYFTVSLVPVASLSLAVLFALGIVALPILYVHLANEYRYAIVIDAGSSHTHVYAYRWDIPRYKDTGEIEQRFHCYNSKSLNSYTSDPQRAGNLTERCINMSLREEAIPKSQRKDTYLYLGATAGMRLVHRKDPRLSEEIMQSINSSLAGLEYHLKSGRIITGQEEAVSGWVAGNFLSHSLKSGSSLTGSLDMGGASTEIAFQHSSSDPSDQPYQTSVRLFDKTHSLYARSYLCYGLNEARLRLLANLSNSTEGRSVSNPCLLKDAVITYNTSDIFSSECVNTNSSDIFGFGFSPPLSSEAGEDDGNITFTGTGDPEKCRDIIRQVFDLENCSDPSVCIDNKKYFWPPVNNSGTFLGMSGFFSVANFFNATGHELHNFTQYNDSIHTFCQLTNTSASQIYNNSFLQDQCFNGVFILFLLQTGFGFNSSNTNWTLMFKEQVGDTSVGWAMGYLVNQTTLIPDDPHQVQRPFQSVDLVVGIVVLSILCLVSLVFFSLTFHACRKALKSRGGYSTLS